MSWNFEINDKTKSIVQSKILTAKVISQLRLIVFKIIYVSADDMSHLEYISLQTTVDLVRIVKQINKRLYSINDLYNTGSGDTSFLINVNLI